MTEDWTIDDPDFEIPFSLDGGKIKMRVCLYLLALVFFSINSFAGITLTLKDKGQSRKPSSSYEGDGNLYFEINQGELQPVVLSAFSRGSDAARCVYSSSMKTEFNDKSLCISSGKLELKNGSLMFNNYPLNYSWSIGPEDKVRDSLGSVAQTDISEIKKVCNEVFKGKNCYIKVWYKSGQLEKFPNSN